jgi:hypothetical protein
MRYYNQRLTFPELERLAREHFAKENVYLPLPECARKELEQRRIDDLAEDKEQGELTNVVRDNEAEQLAA